MNVHYNSSASIYERRKIRNSFFRECLFHFLGGLTIFSGIFIQKIVSDFLVGLFSVEEVDCRVEY
jgi:hypothetical protein